MSSDETYQERQNNEIAVLKAIFEKNLVDLRQSEIWVPLEIRVTVLPQQGSSGLQEKHAQIDMHVVCSSEYPDKEPKIILENSRGLSNEQIKKLQSELEHLAVKSKGEVMIHILIEHAKLFLHEHNYKPEYESFWDEMFGRREKQKQQILLAKQIQEDEERQRVKDEILRREEMLRSEQRNRRNYRRVSESDSGLINPVIERTKMITRKRCISSSENIESSQCRGVKELVFTNKGERKIYRGRCLGHSPRGSTLYAGLDMVTGEIVAVSEWQFKLKNSNAKEIPKSGNDVFLLSDCMKCVGIIEQELHFLTTLRHRNLVNYINIKYTIQENECIFVYLLQEFVVGTTCSSFVQSENFTMEYDMIRYFSEEILNGLDYLHKNNVIHRDVRDSCVFIDNNGIVKLGDCSVEKRLYEFSTRTQNQHRKDNKKTDIYKFGLLILSLIRGSLIDENEEKHLKVPVKLPLDLRDFLNKCIVADERDRWSAAQLLKHNFIRARIERCSPARVLDSTPPKNGDGRGDSDKSNDDDTEDDFDIHSLIPVQNGGQSRIQTEFEILKWLGRGAFGDVLKVKNKLDGGCYAIKRIRLNPNNIQLNRKITREVKLLSRLSHENVVRYYNSWIEKADIKEENTPGKHAANMSPLGGKTKNNDDLTGFVIEDLEKINPNKLEWSTSCGGKNQNSTSSDEDSSDDEEWSVVFNPENNPESESSDSIEFERDNSTNSDTASLQSIKESTKNVKNVTVKNAITRQIQFMYIQMELCEKSTLRTAIDKGLHKDNDRVWRLFREIVDGLSHIHQQGMIHRDLKPVNIFLDSNDHVKIGDFGLATSNIITRPNTGIEIINKSTQEFGESNSQDTPSVGDGSLTGEVGTALYVAPEIITKASKTYIYNQKVDIYSLGIILFEMVYPPLPTAMERVKVLANLRQKAIIFPTDFNDVQYSRFLRIIRWLLHHDPSQRPTTQELLQSQHIPPPQIEEGELQDLLRRTLANTQTKAYKYLISSCFDQNLSTADDITYDLPREDFIAERPLLIEKVKETITEIFKLHGGDCLTTPLLMPRSKYYEGVDSCVKMMSHSGYIVTIPHDLRIPFARYVARNNIHLMKRYSIERVYREKKVHGFHPRELYECAFDIITPKPGKLMAEAELLSIVYEIIQEFPKIKHKNYTIRLNHRSLLRAMLLYGGIEEEKHNDIYSILSDARDNKLSKFQVQTHLISLCLTDNGVIQVGKLMETEVSLKNLKSHFRPLTRRKGEIGDLAKKAIDDLELITNNTEALGVKCNIIVAPGLVHNIQQYSGMMCQFVCELQSKKKKTMGVIAAGGRFDEMLQSFRSILGQTGIISKGDLPQSGAGISISIDTLVQLLREEQHDINSANADVHICSTDSKSMIREKCSILRDFWSAGIRCSLIDTNLMYDNLDEKRKIKSVHTVILKDSDLGMALVRSSDKDRFQEKKVPISELVEFVQRLLRTWNGSTNESVSSSNLYSRSDSRSMSISSDISPGNLLPDVTVRFVTHEKLSATARRRLENQILSHLTLKLQQVSNRSKVIILAVHLDSSVIKTLISHIDLESDYSEFQRDVTCAIERCPGQKKHILELSEHIFTICNENNSAVIVLYSVPDSYFKILF